MARRRRLLIAPLVALALPAALAGGAAARATVERSPELWATVDVCHPADQPGTVGVRASMPGNGRADETLYMRFRVQYENPSTHVWLDSAGADSGYVKVGSAAAHAVQAGRSFRFDASGGHRFVLRGVVDFQWRRETHVVIAAAVHTLAGHGGGAGADPPGFSAGTCSIG